MDLGGVSVEHGELRFAWRIVDWRFEGFGGVPVAHGELRIKVAYRVEAHCRLEAASGVEAASGELGFCG